MLRGKVVLCLPQALKMDDIHLRLTGDLRLAFVRPWLCRMAWTLAQTDLPLPGGTTGD